jgi:RNA polymerase sigma factor (sigma-70 family)
MLRTVRLYRFASDEHLVDRVRAGSAPAFEVLFDRHHRPLLAFCRHMLGSAADAEDAVQHTFMAAYADLMRSDKPIALRPWLYSIARHRCMSMLRARRERPVAELPEPEVDDLAAEVYTRAELRATLSDIAHLPEDQRAALILAELGDASHAEIAEVIGCRQEKVKALVFQARSSLATGRVARDTPCAEIREQLASGGHAVRRTFLRHHVRDCAGCREFGELLRLQRRRLRVLLPVAPSLGLKRAVLGAVLSSGSGATGVTAIVGALGVGGVAATAIVTATIAGGGGSAASAAPAGGDPPRVASAEAADRPARAAKGIRPRGGRPTRATKRPRPAARTPRQSDGRPSTPSAAREPAAAAREPAAGAAAPHVSPAPAVEARTQPAVGGRPPEPPGHARRKSPPGSPGKASGGGRPAEPPGQDRRATPPSEPPGRENRPTPPGPPSEPPGGGQPAEPPGNPDPGPPAGGPDPPAGPSDPGPARPRR